MLILHMFSERHSISIGRDQLAAVGKEVDATFCQRCFSSPEEASLSRVHSQGSDLFVESVDDGLLGYGLSPGVEESE